MYVCAMVTVEVKQAKQDILRAFSGLSSDEVKRCTHRAIARALSSTKTEASKVIREIYRIDKKNADSSMYKKHHWDSSLTGYLMASSFPLSMEVFNPVEIKENVMTKKVGTYKTKSGKKTAFGSTKTRLKTTGVTIEILRGKKKTIKSAFLALKAKGGANVKAFGAYAGSKFQFNPEPVGQSQKLRSKSVLWAIMNDTTSERINKKASEVFSDRLIHELSRAVSKIT